MENNGSPAGERDAWLIRLVEQHQKSLLRLCFLWLGDRAMAEDAVQDTFLKAYRSYESFRGECSEKTWLTRIAVNTCRDMKRSCWFRLTDRRVTPEDLPAAPAQPFDGGDAAALAEAIIRLPLRQREVILLYYYHNMTLVEIAGALGIHVSSVSGRMRHARARLRRALERGDADE